MQLATSGITVNHIVPHLHPYWARRQVSVEECVVSFLQNLYYYALAHIWPDMQTPAWQNWMLPAIITVD